MMVVLYPQGECSGGDRLFLLSRVLLGEISTHLVSQSPLPLEQEIGASPPNAVTEGKKSWVSMSSSLSPKQQNHESSLTTTFGTITVIPNCRKFNLVDHFMVAGFWTEGTDSSVVASTWQENQHTFFFIQKKHIFMYNVKVIQQAQCFKEVPWSNDSMQP